MFPKSNKLSSDEFSRLYANGFRVKGQFGVLISSVSPYPKYRVGFVVNKKVGNAVVRHQTTRHIRNVFRKIVGEYNLPLLYEYIAYTPISDLNAFEDEFKSQMDKVHEHFN
ncbi:MAG TPA: ribonuclease P protein component [Candidatus Dojkabacteria bacterium]|nr:ribonuclease P protein component [Candidatus Dojkabacteria bacterium]